MRLVQIAATALLAAALTAGCTEHPTAVQHPSASRPAFQGGGYMGNGGIVPPTDTTKTESTTTSSDTTDAVAGGGYMGNGG